MQPLKNRLAQRVTDTHIEIIDNGKKFIYSALYAWNRKWFRDFLDQCERELQSVTSSLCEFFWLGSIVSGFSCGSTIIVILSHTEQHDYDKCSPVVGLSDVRLAWRIEDDNVTGSTKRSPRLIKDIAGDLLWVGYSYRLLLALGPDSDSCVFASWTCEPGSVVEGRIAGELDDWRLRFFMANVQWQTLIVDRSS
jgi:hypothetical protein